MHSDDPKQTFRNAQTFLQFRAVDISDSLIESEPSPTTNFSQPRFTPITHTAAVITLLSNSGTHIQTPPQSFHRSLAPITTPMPNN